MSNRLTIFAKGNVDVRDTLHAQRVGNEVVWNGLNEALRSTFPEWRARVRHETWIRSDALVVADGQIPTALRDRGLSLGAHTLESQFQSRLFDPGIDVAVLTIQPDVMNRLARHKQDGHFFHPEGLGTWDPEDRAWFLDRYETVPDLTPDQSMANFRTLIGRLRAQVPHILIYTMSPIMPRERTHAHVGMSETVSWRIRRFNLALIDLSRELDFSIVDVDTILARHGADRLKIDIAHFNTEACRLIADEVVGILEDRGCLDR